MADPELTPAEQATQKEFQAAVVKSATTPEGKLSATKLLILAAPQWILPAGLGVVTVAVVIAVGVAMRNSSIVTADAARVMLATMFAIGTLGMAFALMLGVFLSTDTKMELKDRFGLALQAFTPLVGIVGTVLGFYFGTNLTAPVDPLTIVDVTVPSLKVPSTEKTTLTVLVQGGKGPWVYTLDFGTNEIPKIQRTLNVPFLRETVAVPSVRKDTAMGVKVTVNDALGKSAEWSRDPEHWVTVTAPPPAQPVTPGNATGVGPNPPKTM